MDRETPNITHTDDLNPESRTRVDPLLATCLNHRQISGPVRDLITKALDRGDLQPVDILSLCDLLEFAQCCDDLDLACLLVAMFAVLEEGSLCLYLQLSSFRNRMDEILTEEEIENRWEAIERKLDDGCWSPLIGQRNGQQEIPFIPLVIATLGTESDSLFPLRALYFHRCLHDENILKEQFRSWLGTDSPADLDPVDVPESLHPNQAIALLLAANNPFTIISGGPGTGKTYVVGLLIKELIAQGVDPGQIAATAPTGKAAQRLTESLQQQEGQTIRGCTIHRLLRYQPWNDQFKYHRFKPLPYSVLIVDEVSMVSVNLMAALLDAIAPGSKLIFLGDKDQLPSVEAGSILADLIPDASEVGLRSGTKATLEMVLAKFLAGRPVEIAVHQPARWLTDRAVLLNKSHRGNTEIQQAAEWINQGDANAAIKCFTSASNMPSDPTETPGNFELLLITPPEDSVAGLNTLVLQWTQKHFPADGEFARLIKRPYTANEKEALSEIFQHLNTNRILTVLRHGPFGCEAINQQIHNFLQQRANGRAFYPGMTIMVTRNDYQRGLFNGDIGVILHNHNQTRLEAYFATSHGFRHFPSNALPPYELAYAMTVHKSQGSEYDQVMLVLPQESTHRLLTREIIYTAVTRAKQQVVVVGKEDVLATAISRKINRESGLRPWLQQGMGTQ